MAGDRESFSRWAVTIFVTVALGIAGVTATLVAAGRLPCPVICSSDSTPTPTASQPSTVDIDPTVRLDPASGRAGTAVQLTVARFGTNEKLDISLEGHTLQTGDTDDHGSARITVIIPASYGTDPTRKLTIQVTGETSKVVATAPFQLTVG